MILACEEIISDIADSNTLNFPRCGKKAMWIYSDDVLPKFYLCNDCKEKLVKQFGLEFSPKIELINPKLRCLT